MIPNHMTLDSPLAPWNDRDITTEPDGFEATFCDLSKIRLQGHKYDHPIVTGHANSIAQVVADIILDRVMGDDEAEKYIKNLYQTI